MTIVVYKTWIAGEVLTAADLNASFARVAGAAGGVETSAPLTGATVTASAGAGRYIAVPVGTLATLNVVLPSGAVDTQTFEFITSQTITAINVTDPGGAVVKGGTGMLTANGGMSWSYSTTDATWYRRY